MDHAGCNAFDSPPGPSLERALAARADHKLKEGVEFMAASLHFVADDPRDLPRPGVEDE
jgi:hypothetical protein